MASSIKSPLGKEPRRPCITGDDHAQETNALTSPRDKIFILGWPGAVGKLIAHSLAGSPKPPTVVLLHHSLELQRRWEGEHGGAITLEKHGIEEAQRGFQSASATPSFQRNNPNAEPIYHLILTSKTYMAVKALQAVAWRLRPESTIVFIQNGMGFGEEVDKQVFPDPETRPHYMFGIVNHGVLNGPDFLVKHRGSGSIALTARQQHPQDIEEEPRAAGAEFQPFSASFKNLLRALTGSPALHALGLREIDFLQVKLEKLAANAVINPLTALFGVYNGELLDNEPMLRLMRLLLTEISLVICSLPELKNLPNKEQRFSPQPLEHYTVGLAKSTAGNISSMRQDMDQGKTTEIDYINGYFVRKGGEMGIRSTVNHVVVEMIKAKVRASSRDLSSIIPMDDTPHEP